MQHATRAHKHDIYILFSRNTYIFGRAYLVHEIEVLMYVLELPKYFDASSHSIVHGMCGLYRFIWSESPFGQRDESPQFRFRVFDIVEYKSSRYFVVSES